MFAVTAIPIAAGAGDRPSPAATAGRTARRRGASEPTPSAIAPDDHPLRRGPRVERDRQGRRRSSRRRTRPSGSRSRSRRRAGRLSASGGTSTLKFMPNVATSPTIDDREQHDRRVRGRSAGPRPGSRPTPRIEVGRSSRGTDRSSASRISQYADDHGDEAERVDQEGDRHAERADQRCPPTAGPTIRAVLKSAEFSPTALADVVPPDHLDRERLARRHVDRVREAEDHRDDQDVPDLDQAGHAQPEQDEARGSSRRTG